MLLAAVEAWGFEQTLIRMVGMFALAVWDRQERVLSLARDRIGEKPLYYGEVERFFCFASELKAIRALTGSRLEIDNNAVSEFMQFGYVPSPHCIYRGLNKLAPGHFVQVRPGRIVDASKHTGVSTMLLNNGSRRNAPRRTRCIVGSCYRAASDASHALQMIRMFHLGRSCLGASIRAQ